MLLSENVFPELAFVVGSPMESMVSLFEFVICLLKLFNKFIKTIRLLPFIYQCTSVENFFIDQLFPSFPAFCQVFFVGPVEPRFFDQFWPIGL